MAEIYLVKVGGLANFEKHLVLKVIHPKFAADPEFVEMLVHEAKLLVRLTHANIAQVFDLGDQDGRYFIAMEYVDGLDVFQFLRRLRENRTHMPFEVAAFVIAEVCGALDYAHNRRDEAGRGLGIIHRDISPQNVLLSYEGDVKVIDFGIAKVRASSQSTAAGIIKGKFFYMSPEQACGQDLDHRSDIFSVGALFYELLTLRMLYDTESINDALRLAKRGAFLPASTHRPDLPQPLERIVLKSLAREREQRYQTADEMRRDLNGWLRKAVPGFGRHRLEGHIRDVCGINTQVRLARMRRDEFRAQRHQSMIVREDPTEDREALREADVATREITPSIRQHGEALAQEAAAAAGRGGDAADALARRIREARANLRWTDEHDVPGEADEPTVEDPVVRAQIASATTLTQVRTDDATVPRSGRQGQSWPPIGEDDTERDLAHERPTRPPTPPVTPAPRPPVISEVTDLDFAPTRPVAGAYAAPSVLEAEGSPLGEHTDVDATVVDPGPLARALEEAEAVMHADDPDHTPSSPRSEGTTSPYRRERPPVWEHPRAPTRSNGPARAAERPARSRSAEARRPAAWAPAPESPPELLARPRSAARPAVAQLPIQRAEQRDDFADSTWPEPISGALPSRPRSISRGLLVGVGGIVMAIGVALGFLLGPDSIEPVPDGILFVTSRPVLGARIYLNGQRTDLTTPSRIEGLPGNSRHQLRIELAGYHDADAEGVVRPGANTEVMLSLEPVYFTAHLESVPPGAEIVIGGQVVGRTPSTLRGLSVDRERALNVLLRLPRHLDSVFTLRWPEGETHLNRTQTLTPER